MKKKVITALLITMTLTLGGVGTAYAMNNDMAVLSGETVNDVNMIKEGFIWVVDKEAWDEIVKHQEEGHWEPVKDEEKPENPEQKLDEEKPEIPEQKPDEQTPEKPEQTPDTQKPEVKPEQEKNDTQKAPEQESKKEDTNNAPKTGDPTNLAYLAILAGSALVGGVSWKFRKRK